MGKCCTAIDCCNRFFKSCGLHFYIFPTDIERRNLWVASVKRKDWKPTKYTWICSAHFVGGSKSDDPASPAYIPTLFQHVRSPTKRKAESQLASYNRRNATKRRRLDAIHQDKATMTLLELSSNTEPEGNMDIVLLVVMCKKMLICVGILLQTLTILKPAY